MLSLHSPQGICCVKSQNRQHAPSLLSGSSGHKGYGTRTVISCSATFYSQLSCPLELCPLQRSQWVTPMNARPVRKKTKQNNYKPKNMDSLVSTWHENLYKKQFIIGLQFRENGVKSHNTSHKGKESCHGGLWGLRLYDLRIRKRLILPSRSGHLYIR